MTNITRPPYDCHLNCERYIAEFIEAQFPMLYREHGRELIAFMEEYYRFEEETQYQFLHETNCLPEKDDIDTTLDEFVVYFKNKYMKDMPFTNKVDNRFIIKNIFDLYQSKGTERSLKLLMYLMYGEKVDVYYPGQDVLRPSHSIWYQPRYLEVSHSPKTQAMLGKKVYGSVSGAEAFVDSVVTKRVDGRLFDVLYLSDVRGQFNTKEYIVDVKGVTGFGYPYTTGSLGSIIIPDNSSYGYSVGDLLDVKSACGDQAIVRVTEVARSDVRINFTLNQLGYGYAPTAYANGAPIVDSITEIYISDSILGITNSNLVDGDTLTQYFQSVELDQVPNAVPGDVLIYGALQGTIISITGNTVLVEGDPTDSFPITNFVTINGDTYFTGNVANSQVTTTVMESSDTTVWGYDTTATGTQQTFYRSTIRPSYAYDQNGYPYQINRVYGGSGANFEIVNITNQETISFNTDVIGSNNVFGAPYLGLTIDSADYGFPNPNADGNQSNLTTALGYAFATGTTTIGSPAYLSLVNPGIGYESDIKIKVITPIVIAAQIHDVVFTMPSIQGFGVGQTITQISTGALGRIIAVNNTLNTVTVRPLSYTNRFRENIPVIVDQTGKSYLPKALYRDPTSPVMGSNMVVTGKARAADGEIRAVDIVSSGFGYCDNEDVTLYPHNKSLPIVYGTSYLGGAGKSAGTWRSHTSHLNWSTYIHDNYYYQEYSYDIKSSVPLDKYKDVVENVVHVAGNEIFGSVVKQDDYIFDYKVQTQIELLSDGYERYVKYGYVLPEDYVEKVYTGNL